MLKAILLGGLIVSLASFFHNGGFQNRGTGTGSYSRRPSTRYGPPGAWKNESSTEPYFRIILSSNSTIVKSTGPTPVSKNGSATFSDTEIGSSSTLLNQDNKTAIRSDVKFESINSTSEKPLLLKITSLQTTTSLSRSEQVESAKDSNTVDPKLSSTSTVTQASDLLVESTSAEPPKVTTSKVSSTFVYENITSIFPSTSTTKSSILIESTNGEYSKPFTTAPKLSTIVQQSSTLLIESTSEEPPKSTASRLSSTFVHENKISILTSTESSILIESTKRNYPGRFTTLGFSSVGQEVFRTTNIPKTMVETITEAEFTYEDSENQQSGFRSKPLNYFIPPTISSLKKEEVSFESDNSTAPVLNVSIPPAYYLPPRVQPFPSI